MTYIKTIFFFTILFVTMALTGCSSCTVRCDQTCQPINIETLPVCGATCFLENDKGRWCLPSTPGTVIVARSCHNLFVTVEKTGYQAVSFCLSPRIQRIFDNISSGCLAPATYGYQNILVIPFGCPMPGICRPC